jgi:hypothetical protein
MWFLFPPAAVAERDAGLDIRHLMAGNLGDLPHRACDDVCAVWRPAARTCAVDAPGLPSTARAALARRRLPGI